MKQRPPISVRPPLKPSRGPAGPRLPVTALLG